MDSEQGLNMTELVKRMAIEFASVISEMSPYLLFGFLVAGILSVLVSKQWVQRHLGGKGIGSVVKASIFGVPLPLCSCGVIPVAMSLKKSGAGKGAAISFLLSTPQTGVDSIFVTFSLLGPVFAVFRPLAAFITGIIGGIFTNAADKEEQQPAEQIETQLAACCGKKKSKIAEAFRYGFVTLPADIGKPLLVGLFIAAVISALIPQDYFADKLGTGFLPMVLMMLMGIPVYVCATASVPIAAALMLKGLSAGAVFVFLMTGPATNAASVVTIFKQLGKAAGICYLVTVAVCALGFGYILDMAISNLDIDIVMRPGWMLPDSIKYSCTAVLLIILAAAAVKGKKNA